MKTCLITRISLAALLCLLVITSYGCIVIADNCCSANVKHETTAQASAPLAPGSMLIAETTRGSITVTGDDVSDCSVTATIVAHAESDDHARRLAEQVHIKLVHSGNKLTVKVDKPDSIQCGFISVSLDIVVPKQTSLQCADSRGSIEIANINGDVKAHTTRGSVTIQDVDGSVHADSSRGSITCRNVSADTIKLQTTRGSISVTQTNCTQLKLNSSRGNIDVVESTADSANISSSRGNVSYKHATTAELTAHSSRGSIDISYAPSAQPEIIADVSASRGNIDFAIPPAFSGNVDLSVNRGSVKSNVPITITGQISKERISGTIGQGKGNLRLHSSRGSIKIM